MAATKCVDLKVDKTLLDPFFDGYKLSLDPLPMYRVNLDSCKLKQKPVNSGILTQAKTICCSHMSS